MRQDLEEWLKGNTDKLKRLEASGKYSGLPVVRLAASSEASFRPVPEDSTALQADEASPAAEGKPAAEFDDSPEFPQEEASPSDIREGDPASSSSSSPSHSQGPAEPPLIPSEEVVHPEPDELAVTPEREERESFPLTEDLSFQEGKKEKKEEEKMDEAILPTNDGEDGPPEEIGGDISTDAPSREAPEDRTVPSEPSPPNEETDAAPEPEGREADHAAHLRRVTHTRRAAVESSSPGQVPQRRMRLALLCTVAILVLGTTFALYRHIQNNSQSAIAQEAQTLYDEGRYDEAMASYQRGFDRYPDSREFLLGLARSSVRAGQPDQALTAWRLYLDQIPEEDKPDRAQALYEIGRLYAQKRAPDKAIEHLVQSSNLDPTRYDTHFALGRLLEERNRPAEALNAYRHALELRPSSQEALDAVKRVAGLVVDQPASTRGPDREYEKHLEVGAVALNLKRYDDALSHFNQALSIKSDDERPWLGLVGVHQGKGNDAEALKLLQDAQKLLPDSVTIGAKIDELNQKPKKKEKPASASAARRRKKSVEKQ